MTVKAVVFDLGNVIVFVEDRMTLCQKISQWGGTPDAIYDFIFLQGIEEAFDKGEIPPAEFFERVQCRFSLKASFEDFARVWCSGFLPNNYIVPVIKGLKPKYQLSLLSNTNELHYKEIERKNQILAAFDTFFLSFLLGIRKPDPSIFRLVLDHLSIAPQECVYIDDIEEFVATARRLGIKGVVYKDIPSLKESLACLGVRIV